MFKNEFVINSRSLQLKNLYSNVVIMRQDIRGYYESHDCIYDDHSSGYYIFLLPIEIHSITTKYNIFLESRYKFINHFLYHC